MSRIVDLNGFPKDDYPTVKAKVYTEDEVLTMFKELQLEIEEKSFYDTHIIGNYEDEVRVNLVELDDVNKIIQEKINALKGEGDGTNEKTSDR